MVEDWGINGWVSKYDALDNAVYNLSMELDGHLDIEVRAPIISLLRDDHGAWGEPE